MTQFVARSAQYKIDLFLALDYDAQRFNELKIELVPSSFIVQQQLVKM